MMRHVKTTGLLLGVVILIVLLAAPSPLAAKQPFMIDQLERSISD